MAQINPSSNTAAATEASSQEFELSPECAEIIEDFLTRAADPVSTMPPEVKEFMERLTNRTPGLKLTFGQLGFSGKPEVVSELMARLKDIQTSSNLILPISTSFHDTNLPPTKKNEPRTQTFDTVFSFIEKPEGDPIQFELIAAKNSEPLPTYHKVCADTCSAASIHYAFSAKSEDDFKLAVILADNLGARILQEGEISQDGFSAKYAYFEYISTDGVPCIVEFSYVSPSMGPSTLEFIKCFLGKDKISNE